MNRPAGFDKASGCECGAVLGDLGWDNAVEHIDASVHALENVQRRSYAHQVARAICWQKLGCEFAGCLALFLAFANCQPANCVAIEGKVGELGRTLASQIGKERTLHNGKHRLQRIATSGQASLRPAMG